MSTPLEQLAKEQVSVWLDDLSRERLESGNLASLIDRGVAGVTTNPTIFASALANGERYTEQMRELARANVSLDDAVLDLTTTDVRAACDLLSGVYEATDGLDGRVSIEVDPGLARDTEGTVAMATRLAKQVDRPNVFVKIPATEEGLSAIAATIAQGISVNVTLIFALERYRRVMDAFLHGLEQAAARGLSLKDIHSVASFFVSRVDGAVDAQLPGDSPLRGTAAIANARLAYEACEQTFATERFAALARQGAHVQRPLWASTGVKNPEYRDTMYVTELVAADTVNTMPEKTLEAVAARGEILGDTVRGSYEDSREVMRQLADAGISYEQVVADLEEDGLAKFQVSWDELVATVRTELASQA